MRSEFSYRFSPLKVRTLSDQRFLAAWTFVGFLVSVLLMGAIAAMTFYEGLAGIGPWESNGNPDTPREPEIPPWEIFGTDKVTFILLGYDEVDEFAHRSDTLMVGAVDFYARTVRIISIPRDTLVYIPRHSFMKVNSAYALGGENLVLRTVENFMGIDIDYVIQVNYQGFREVVDALGGVDITVEHAMHYDDRRGNVHIHIEAGEHHFDGEQALNYARFRHDARGDLSRIERQQYLLKELMEQRITPGNLTRFKRAADAFLENISVSVNEESPRNVPEIGFEELISLTGFLSRLGSDDIRFYQVPVEDIVWEGLACLRPIYSATREMLAEVFEDEAPIAWNIRSVPLETVPPAEFMEGVGDEGTD